MEAAERAARAKRRRHIWVMAGMVAAVALLIVGIGGGALWFLAGSEERDREAAEAAYANGQFEEARLLYGKLVDKYPDSADQDNYRFMQELSDIRAFEQRSDRKDAFDRVSTFLKERKDHPLFAEHGKEVAETFVKLLDAAAEAAGKNIRDAEVREHFRRGREVLAELKALNGDWVPPEKVAELEQKNNTIGERVQQETARHDLVERIRKQAENPSTRDVIDTWQSLHGGANPFNDDPEVKAAADELYEKYRDSLRPTQDEVPAPAGRLAEDTNPDLVVQPSVGRPQDDGPPLAADRVVLALARGVLFGLRQSDGEWLWARRVGIDTAHLPVRVRQNVNPHELALYVAADTSMLTAVNVQTGVTLWKYYLGAASRGRLVVIGRRVFATTVTGEVHEVELAGGRLLHRYNLGQPLSYGGVRLGDTSLVAFPGDSSCVYVLDVDRHVCEAVLFTGHPADSLCGEPIVLPSEEDPPPACYLVLFQRAGGDATVLRTFKLSKEGRLRAEAVDMPERRLRGEPSFPPYSDPETGKSDPEKLVLATDAGVLGLFGIVQPHNHDAPLFPLIRVEGNDEGTVELPGPDDLRGRAEVVFTQGSDVWVLARGRLARILLTLDENGPRAVPYTSWGPPGPLGTPLHASQVDDKGTTLFLVTNSPNGQACLATAVDTESGHVRWQRQLGLVCRGEPRRLGADVIALDEAGGLFRFNEADAGPQGPVGEQKVAEPLPYATAALSTLVPSPDGAALYEFAAPDPGGRVIVREYRAGAVNLTDHAYEVSAPLAGTPAVGPRCLLLPLANGSTRLVRLPLGSSPAVEGPPWRAARGDRSTRGHVAWLGGDDFLVTNGQRGLKRWRVLERYRRPGADKLTKAGVDPKKLDSLPDTEFDSRDAFVKELDKALGEDAPERAVVLNLARIDRYEGGDPEKPTVELTGNVVGAPAVLSRAGAGTKLRVCAADDHGTVYLFEDDALNLVHSWALKGPVTAGPFVRGDRVGCVVGGRRLVWLDPAKAEPAWTYESHGEDIVGQPQLADGMVVVADVSGLFVGIDPETGQVRGPGYQLRSSVMPAAAPADFGAGRAFAPLTDGTVLLLPLASLREPLPGLPPVW
jgi:outer membrane protein assembly factor BamB